eukprot:GHVT01090165.1.p1 GENE.GHVT01090165.1~~GHVT01090165.1.p1  ORF type:complete len:277 (+),score=64.11 GHVT01090165.1:1365-2195(+)
MVGIETHAQLLTSSKLLCPCKRLPSASPLWHRVGAPLAQAPASLAAACALPSPAAAAPTATATATATAPSHSALNGEASASNGEASALNGEASALNGEASALNGEASALNGEASAAACGGGSPSASFCPICTGEPGALPLLNRRAVELAVKAALALNCSIGRPSGPGPRHNSTLPRLPATRPTLSPPPGTNRPLSSPLPPDPLPAPCVGGRHRKTLGAPTRLPIGPSRQPRGREPPGCDAQLAETCPRQASPSAAKFSNCGEGRTVRAMPLPLPLP